MKIFEPAQDEHSLENTIPFADRLDALRISLIASAENVAHSMRFCPESEQEKAAAESIRLASFAGYLATAARRHEAEVSESAATLPRTAPLSPVFKKQLAEKTDEKLHRRLNGNHNDGDGASLARQVELFCDALRERHRGELSRGR